MREPGRTRRGVEAVPIDGRLLWFFAKGLGLQAQNLQPTAKGRPWEVEFGAEGEVWDYERVKAALERLPTAQSNLLAECYRRRSPVQLSAMQPWPSWCDMAYGAAAAPCWRVAQQLMGRERSKDGELVRRAKATTDRCIALDRATKLNDAMLEQRVPGFCEHDRPEGKLGEPARRAWARRANKRRKRKLEAMRGELEAALAAERVEARRARQAVSRAKKLLRKLPSQVQEAQDAFSRAYDAVEAKRRQDAVEARREHAADVAQRSLETRRTVRERAAEQVAAWIRELLGVEAV